MLPGQNQAGQIFVYYILSLIQCESEQEVIDRLKKKYWDEQQSWQYFGNDEGNYSIIGNQQSKPEAAIVDKIIDSADAMLFAEWLQRDINPEGNETPQSISETLIR